MIKTKPATKQYRDNFDAAFNRTKQQQYKIPVDITIFAASAEEAKQRILGIMRDVSIDYVLLYEFPVEYPTNPV